MAYYTIRKDYINVIGRIWEPGFGPCAYTYTLRAYDLANMGVGPHGEGLTREKVQAWLNKNAGDFQVVIDFEVSVGHYALSWQDEESELIYNDCTNGGGE
jgi:hypothetical protein